MNDNASATLTVTNVIESGAAFAVKHGSGETCYIPATVAFTSGAKAGDVITAVLVENPNETARERTPYMARYVTPKDKPVDPFQAMLDNWDKKQPIDFIRDTLKEGGVWTTESMFDLVRLMHDDQITIDTVRRMLGALFQEGACARFTMVKGPRQLTPSREWFTAHPDRADVDEFDEAVQ
jgi:hypothetical protein